MHASQASYIFIRSFVRIFEINLEYILRSL